MNIDIYSVLFKKSMLLPHQMMISCVYIYTLHTIPLNNSSLKPIWIYMDIIYNIYIHISIRIYIYMFFIVLNGNYPYYIILYKFCNRSIFKHGQFPFNINHTRTPCGRSFTAAEPCRCPDLRRGAGDSCGSAMIYNDLLLVMIRLQ